MSDERTSAQQWRDTGRDDDWTDADLVALIQKAGQERLELRDQVARLTEERDAARASLAVLLRTEIHPDDDQYGTSCDWGQCANEAKFWRVDPRTAHELPVCADCAIKDDDAWRARAESAEAALADAADALCECGMSEHYAPLMARIDALLAAVQTGEQP